MGKKKKNQKTVPPQFRGNAAMDFLRAIKVHSQEIKHTSYSKEFIGDTATEVEREVISIIRDHGLDPAEAGNMISAVSASFSAKSIKFISNAEEGTNFSLFADEIVSGVQNAFHIIQSERGLGDSPEVFEEVRIISREGISVGILLGLWELSPKSYFMSPDLEKMFSHTNLSKLSINQIPLDKLNIFDGSNYPIFIKFNTGKSVGGLVYSSWIIKYIEKEEESSTNINVVGIGENTSNFWRFNVPHGAPIEDWIKNTFSDEEQHLLLKSLICASLYITSPDADMVLAKDSEIYRNWIKNMQEKGVPSRMMKEAEHKRSRLGDDTHYMGQFVTINRHKNVSKELGGTHASPLTHWRDGYFRRQHYGPREDNLVKTVFIEPTIVNGHMGIPLSKGEKKYKLV